MGPGGRGDREWRRAGTVLRAGGVIVALASLGTDCGTWYVGDYDHGVAPPQYIAREEVVYGLTTLSPLSAAVVGLPALALLLAAASVAIQGLLRERSRQQGTSLPRWKAGVLAVVAVSLLGLTSIAGNFDTSGTAGLTAVAMSSPARGWAVGYYDFNQGGVDGTIWGYQDGRWSEVSRMPWQLYGVVALPDGQAWAVGDGGRMLHEVGGRWTGASSGTTDQLDGVAMVSPDEGWAVGGSERITVAQATVGGSVNLAAAVSLPGTCAILHYSGGRWSRVSCPFDHHLSAVTALPDGEAWAVGNGAVLHETGGVWSRVAAPAAGLAAIAMVSPDTGWASGSRGALLRCAHGTWTAVPSLTNDELAGISMRSADDAWTVGGSTLLHWDGTSWTASAVPGNEELAAVAAGSRGGQGWIVGSANGPSPLIVRETPSGWRAVST